MIDLDALVRWLVTVILFGAFLFVSFQWASAEQEIRNLVEVGSSMGEGWSRCMLEASARLDRVEGAYLASMSVNADHDHVP